MTSAELIQFGQQIANLHRRRAEDAPCRGGSPALRRRQATVERLPDHGGDRCTALPRESPNPLVALIVDENLQPVGQHAHTLACAYGAETGFPVRAGSLMILFHLRVDGGSGHQEGHATVARRWPDLRASVWAIVGRVVSRLAPTLGAMTVERTAGQDACKDAVRGCPWCEPFRVTPGTDI